MAENSEPKHENAAARAQTDDTQEEPQMNESVMDDEPSASAQEHPEPDQHGTRRHHCRGFSGFRGRGPPPFAHFQRFRHSPGKGHWCQQNCDDSPVEGAKEDDANVSSVDKENMGRAPYHPRWGRNRRRNCPMFQEMGDYCGPWSHGMGPPHHPMLGPWTHCMTPSCPPTMGPWRCGKAAHPGMMGPWGWRMAAQGNDKQNSDDRPVDDAEENDAEKNDADINLEDKEKSSRGQCHPRWGKNRRRNCPMFQEMMGSDCPMDVREEDDANVCSDDKESTSRASGRPRWGMNRRRNCPFFKKMMDSDSPVDKAKEEEDVDNSSDDKNKSCKAQCHPRWGRNRRRNCPMFQEMGDNCGPWSHGMGPPHHPSLGPWAHCMAPSYPPMMGPWRYSMPTHHRMMGTCGCAMAQRDYPMVGPWNMSCY